MAIVDQINRDITEAMKAREAERLSALRMVKTALKMRETELPGGVDDAEAQRVLNTLLKLPKKIWRERLRRPSGRSAHLRQKIWAR